MAVNIDKEQLLAALQAQYKKLASEKAQNEELENLLKQETELSTKLSELKLKSHAARAEVETMKLQYKVDKIKLKQRVRESEEMLLLKEANYISAKALLDIKKEEFENVKAKLSEGLKKAADLALKLRETCDEWRKLSSVAATEWKNYESEMKELRSQNEAYQSEIKNLKETYKALKAELAAKSEKQSIDAGLLSDTRQTK